MKCEVEAKTAMSEHMLTPLQKLINYMGNITKCITLYLPLTIREIDVRRID